MGESRKNSKSLHPCILRFVGEICMASTCTDDAVRTESAPVLRAFDALIANVEAKQTLSVGDTMAWLKIMTKCGLFKGFDMVGEVAQFVSAGG